MCNISPIERVETNRKTICLRKAALQDNSDDIPITVFGELADKGKEQSKFILTDFRVSKCVTTKLLKSTEMVKIQKTETESYGWYQ